MTGFVVQDQSLEKHIERQMGCMAGFFQIFDRHHALTGGHKRLSSTKRFPPSTGNNSIPDAEKRNVASPVISREVEKQPQQVKTIPPSPLPEIRSPAMVTKAPPKLSPLPIPLPIFDGTNKTSWAPRLSLDSRATFDAAKGSLKPREIRTLTTGRYDKNGVAGGEGDTGNSDTQRRSPSVIARLMGLEQLPGGGRSDPEEKKPELRRSASESRASRDLPHHRFIDGANFQLKQSSQQHHQQHKKQSSQQQHPVYNIAVRDGAVKVKTTTGRRVCSDPKGCNVSIGKVRAEPTGRVIGQRKSFFDSSDFFPEPKQTVCSIYGEIEKRLKMRGIDEPSKHLKQILEALQLKGLLHSNKPPPFASDQISFRNFVYENRAAYSNDESPIVVMKPSRSNNKRAVSPRWEVVERNGKGQVRGRSPSSPTRSEGGVRSPIKGRGQSSVETRGRGGNGVGSDHTAEQRRVTPDQSPRVSSRRVGTVPDQTVNRSPRGRRPTVEIYRHHVEDELSTVSESSISTSSHTETERWKADEYKEGRSILERCDKLLHSIAEMTAMATTDLQPSPVSVLDSSFYTEESSPSPVMKRNMIDFKDQLAEFEDDIWSPPFSLKSEENSDDSDFLYISDVLRASNCLPKDSDIFQVLENQQYLKGKDTSKVSRLQRKLIFDTITEILQRKRQLPPWKFIALTYPAASGQSSLKQIWSEFQRIRERDASDDLFEVICGVLKKDLSRDAINGWEDCPVEMSESVLDIERLIFKDLIGETIRDLAAFTGNSLPRRKLVF